MTWKMVGKWFCGDFFCVKKEKNQEKIFISSCVIWKMKTFKNSVSKDHVWIQDFFKDNLYQFLDFSYIDNIRKKHNFQEISFVNLRVRRTCFLFFQLKTFFLRKKKINIWNWTKKRLSLREKEEKVKQSGGKIFRRIFFSFSRRKKIMLDTEQK